MGYRESVNISICRTEDLVSNFMIQAKMLTVVLLVVTLERASSSALDRIQYDEERYLLLPIGDTLYDNPQVEEM